jgi:hypothetical protein
MPLGEITLIPGREGAGKSTFLAWLAAQITNGNLPGHHHHQPRAVLYAASEDAWDYTIAPRMLVAGANLDLVHRVDVLTPDGHEGIILPKDTSALAEQARDADAAILMCDPIINLVDERLNTFHATELRQALTPLKVAAETAEIAVAALVHFNKGAHADINSMISGSRGWAEVARAVIAIARDKDADDYTCVLSQTKNNLGRDDLPNLTFTLDSVALDATDGTTGHWGRVRMTGESDVSAEELLTGTATNRALSESTLAVLRFVNESGREVTTVEVARALEGHVKYDAVKRILSRSVQRGDIASPHRGTYTRAQKQAKKARS